MILPNNEFSTWPKEMILRNNEYSTWQIEMIIRNNEYSTWQTEMIIRNNEYSTWPIEMMQQLLRSNQMCSSPRIWSVTRVRHSKIRVYSIISISHSQNLGFNIYVCVCPYSSMIKVLDHRTSDMLSMVHSVIRTALILG